MGQNKPDQAMAAFQESLNLHEETQDLDGLGTAAMTLGDMALFQAGLRRMQRALRQKPGVLPEQSKTIP